MQSGVAWDAWARCPQRHGSCCVCRYTPTTRGCAEDPPIPLPLVSDPNPEAGPKSWSPLLPAVFRGRYVYDRMDLTFPVVLCSSLAMAEAADIPDEIFFEKVEPPTKSQVYKAIVDAKGNLSAAARALGRTRSAIAVIANSTPEIVTLLADLREERVDQAEHNIFNDLDRGDSAASRFVAQTLGKERGWVQTVAGMGKDGAITVEIVTHAPPKEPADGQV